MSDGLGALQRYTNDRPLELPTSAKALWRSLRAALIKASNSKKITTSPGTIEKYVLLLDQPPPQMLNPLRKQGLDHGAFCIVGGQKNQIHDPTLPHIKRIDEALFDFSI